MIRRALQGFIAFWTPAQAVERRALLLLMHAELDLLDARLNLAEAEAEVDACEARIRVLRDVAGVDGGQTAGHNDPITTPENSHGPTT